MVGTVRTGIQNAWLNTVEGWKMGKSKIKPALMSENLEISSVGSKEPLNGFGEGEQVIRHQL